MGTRAVNIYKEKCDVYCGRPKGSGVKFHYGNPFSNKPDSKAVVVLPKGEDCIEACRKWLDGEAYNDVEPERRQWILDHLHELKGKSLGCFCKPKPCHVDLYVERINKTKS